MSIKRNVFWDFTGKFLSFFSRLLISVVLTRLLSPAEFGMFASVFVFANIFQGLVDIGFGAGLIQKQYVRSRDYSSIFWLCFFIAVFLAVVLFISAPFVSDYYNNSELIPLAKSLTVLVLLSGLRKIHEVRNRKNMNFKLSSKLNVTASILAGAIAITYALNSPSVWALIIYEIAFSFLLTIGYWTFSGWVPSLYFNLKIVKSLSNFTRNHFITSVINLIFVRIDYILIGRLFSPSILGNYQRAKSLNQYIKTFSSDSFSNVLFPVFSKIQSDSDATVVLFKRAVRIVSVFSVYLSCLLFLLSTEIFLILFGGEWLISAKYFKLIAIVGYIAPISTIMINLILGQGMSKLYLKVEIIKKLIYIPILVVAYYQGITYFLFGVIVFELLVLVINTQLVSKVVGLKFYSISILYLVNVVSGVSLAIIIYNLVSVENSYASLVLKGFLFTLGYMFLVLKTSEQNRSELFALWSNLKSSILTRFKK